ncbi:hypothetical protein HOY82DRAFT_583828 [Tuber indicum]|nr:hypothetical protein HOY82DRAFT_583828 [Tuber indicum]
MSTRKRKQEAAAEEGEEEEELQALPSDESEEEEEYVDSGPEDSGANWRRAMRMRRKLMMVRGRKMNPKTTRRKKELRQKLKPNRKLRRKRLKTRTRRKRNNPVFPTSSFSLRSIDVRDIIIVHVYFHSTIFCSFSQKNIFGKGKGKTRKAESN